MGIGTSPFTELHGDKGGHYYVRLIGGDVWWYAEDKGGLWAHVFKGVLKKNGQTIIGEWAEIPKGESSNNGKVELAIINDNEAEVSKQTGGFIDSKLKEATIGPQIATA
jgi:hypothetical protein